MGNPAYKKDSSQMAKESLTEIHDLLKKKKNAKILNESLHPLPDGVLDLMMKALESMAEGHSVELVEVNDELSTQEAAELLNVSRPFIVKMIDDGQLSARMIGKHRRVARKDVLEFKEKNTKSRKQSLDELTTLSQDLDLE